MPNAFAALDDDGPKAGSDDGWSTVKKRAPKPEPPKPEVKLPNINLDEVWGSGCKVRVAEGIVAVKLFQTDIVQLRRNGERLAEVS